MLSRTIADEIDTDFERFWRESAAFDLSFSDDQKDFAAGVFAAGREQGRKESREFVLLEQIADYEKTIRRLRKRVRKALSALHTAADVLKDVQ